ncbi:protein deglycase HchA [Actinomycetospora corticicola]|uniref:Molecular chaperone Hsp31 and glyoxalase 3 n=1 Tax=Actinomycetospora corticicola TaxID=663602 RepID=A0A7Y9DSE0_9PSEU|nr:glyoxalase III HchA [Actinomycetospora corticicola]NYD34647.1 molecular chaperone Hsp31 and glyoxalase 3 [Actinomycetospora corticicola]
MTDLTVPRGGESREPTPDPAERDAFFPSPYSLGQYVPPRSDFDGVEHEGAYTEGRWRILVIGTDERYLPMANGRLFSTGNHPVETLLPLMHLRAAGFQVDVATVSGLPVKLEHWATPPDDEAVHRALDELLPQFRRPQRLGAVLTEGLDDHLAVFIPGGHGAMQGLHDSADVQAVLDRFLGTDRFIITLCHGPAALLAAGQDRAESPLAGYEVCAFPDALDTGANLEIGYIPGEMPWLLAAGLRDAGLVVVNDDMAGHVHRDRGLITGDSPLAAHALGKLAADVLVEHVGG